MNLLNFESSGPAPKGNKKSLKIVFGIGALAGVIALGSTFAANINLNTGKPIEFGQSVTAATACDNEIQITPINNFINHPVKTWDYGSWGVANAGESAIFTGPYLGWGSPTKYSGYEVEGAGIARGTRIISARGNTWTYIDFSQPFIGRVEAFNIIFPDRWAFTGISLSSLDTTALTGCVGKTLVLKAYGVSGSSPIATYSIINNGGSFSSPDGVLTLNNIGTTDSSILLTFSDPSVNSDTVYRISIESRNTA